MSAAALSTPVPAAIVLAADLTRREDVRVLDGASFALEQQRLEHSVELATPTPYALTLAHLSDALHHATSLEDVGALAAAQLGPALRAVRDAAGVAW